MNHSDHFYEYQIHLEGHVREDWFEGLVVAYRPDGETVISGPMDQAALHGLLTRIRDLGLVLISAQRYLDEKGTFDE